MCGMSLRTCARALPVDLEQHVVAARRSAARATLPTCRSSCRGRRRTRGTRRAAIIASNVGRVDEVVVDAVLLARARRARRVRDREPDARLALEQRVDERCVLPRARGRDDDEQAAEAGGLCVMRASFDVLHLLAHLLDQHLELERDLRDLVGDGLRAERVRLAVQLLARKSRRLPQRAALRRARAALRRRAWRGARAPRPRRSLRREERELLLHALVVGVERRPRASRAASLST